MIINYRFGAASGTCFNERVALLYRYEDDEFDDPDRQESYVVGLYESGGQIMAGQHAWYTGLWVSRGGAIFVTTADGRVLVNRAPRADKKAWETFPIESALWGVFGLAEDFVVAWGLRGRPLRACMYRFDGHDWRPMSAPEGRVAAVHGLRPDRLYAACSGGLVSRWDGSRWHPLSQRGPNFGALCVVDDDRFYAASASGFLCEGTARGITEILEIDQAITALACFRGDLWLGVMGVGLGRLLGDRIEIVKENIEAISLDAREEMIIGAPDMVARTTDGARFQATLLGAVSQSLRGRPPMWVDDPNMDWVIDLAGLSGTPPTRSHP